MTNEEKAKELYSRWCNCNEHASVEYFLLEMAKWKEQQIIEKAVDWLDKHANEYFPPSYGLLANTAGLLVYYFKKAMEER